LSWTGVDNSEGYRVYVNGTPIAEVKTGTEFTLNLGEGTYVVTVVSIGDGDIFADSFAGIGIVLNVAPTGNIVIATQLDRPEITDIIEGLLTWSGAQNATSYRVIVNGVVMATVIAEDNSEYSFNLNALALGNANYIVRVIAVGNGQEVLDSQMSNAVIFESEIIIVTSLPRIETPFVDIVGDILIWNFDGEATGYKILINGEEVSRVNAGELSFALSNLNLVNGNYVASVIALGDNINFADSLPGHVAYSVTTGSNNNDNQPVIVRLERPGNVQISVEGVLTWVGVQNASGYRIYVNNTPLAQTNALTMSYDMNNLKLEAGTYLVTIVAIGNGTTTSDSHAALGVTFTVIEPPEEKEDEPSLYSKTDVDISEIIAYAVVGLLIFAVLLLLLVLIKISSLKDKKAKRS